MDIIQKVFIGIVIILHLWFLYLEMFLYTKPTGLKLFKNDAESAAKSSSLAANIGLYNGFLASGLIWSLCAADPAQSFQLKLFFLIFILIAGIYGSITANKNIIFYQALPALIALGFVVLSKIMIH